GQRGGLVAHPDHRAVVGSEDGDVDGGGAGGVGGADIVVERHLVGQRHALAGGEVVEHAVVGGERPRHRARDLVDRGGDAVDGQRAGKRGLVEAGGRAAGGEACHRGRVGGIVAVGV